MGEGRNNKELNGVTLLGNQNTKYENDYNPDVLETFVNKHQGNDYWVTFNCPEFTSLCVTGDTKVDVVRNEHKQAEAVPIKELVGTEGLVYSFDTITGLPVVKRYHSVRKTREDAAVLRIHLERMDKTTTYVDVTPDHPILIGNNWQGFAWTLAKKLEPGMQLVAAQRTTDTLRGYRRAQLILEAQLGRQMTAYEDIRFIDGDDRNITAENLQLVSKLEGIVRPYEPVEINDNDDKTNEVYHSSRYLSSTPGKSSVKMEGGKHDVCVDDDSSLAGYQPDSYIDVDDSDPKQECGELYQKGYTMDELSEYFGVHRTTLTKWLKSVGVKSRCGMDTRILRASTELPPLNHKVTRLEYIQNQDVYNMEVEQTECFFANGVVVHNCPKTNQPDFATIYINYVPDVKMVESKSLKLYLFSFRNHGDFHEDCVNIIMEDLYKLMEPRYIEVLAHFLPRGGISIDPFVNRGKPGTDWESFAKLRMLHHNQQQLRVDNR